MIKQIKRNKIGGVVADLNLFIWYIFYKDVNNKASDLLIQSIHRLRSYDKIAIHDAKPLKTACGDFKNKQQHTLFGHFWKDCTSCRKVYLG